jgi:hypothetical protein
MAIRVWVRKSFNQISYLAVGLAAFRGWTEGVRPSAFL